jgi:hypothetical protein
MRFIAGVAIVSLMLLMWGCGSGGNSNNGPMLTLTAGNWLVNMVSTTNPGARSGGGTSLSQTGTTVTGIMHLVSPPCFTVFNDISVNATVNGSTLQLNASTVTGQTISVTATGSATSLSGSYTLGGTACPQDQGTFSAVLVPPATGTWHGTLTSATGPVTEVTATLTQSGPDTHGFFLVSGAMSFSGSCLSSGTISIGQASGAVYVLIVTPSNPGGGEPVSIGGFMTDPATANAFSGFYSSIASTCTDNGTASLSRP